MVDRPIEDRIAYFQRDSWIPYPVGNEILRELEDLLVHPRVERMPSLAICARTNNGKTRLINHFVSRHPADENPGGESIIVPVLYLQCPGVPDESRLYDSILTKLFRKFRVSASPREKLPIVLDALRKIDLRILAIDETNYAESGRKGQQLAFLNALRYISNELRLSIVTLGTDEMMRVLRTIPAVENRFKPAIMPAWECDEAFLKLLASFESLIPLKEPSRLSRQSAATLLHSKCESVLGELKTLLAKSALHAMRQGREKILNRDILECGYVSPSKRKRSAISI